MNKKLFFIFLAAIMVLVCGAAVSADPAAQWDSNYCYAPYCGVNGYFNYNNSINYCRAKYTAPYQAEFVKDITYPDGSYVAPGQTFLKTWRIRNVGTYTWTKNMTLVFTGGDQMGAASCVSLPYNVSPGYYMDITVRMTAPEAETMTKGEWMLRSPDGTLFGVGCNGSVPVWASISTSRSTACTGCVSAYSQTMLYYPTPVTYPIGTSGTNANPSGKMPATPGRNPFCNNRIRKVVDVTIPDGTVVAPGATFRKTWSMKNGGTCIWDGNYVLTQIAGDNLGAPDFVRVTDSLQPDLKYPVNRPAAKVYPDQTVKISVDLVAPTTPGKYEAYFRLRDNYGYEFGYGSYADEAFWVSIVVSDEGSGVVSKEAEPEEAVLAEKSAAPEVVEPAVSDEEIVIVNEAAADLPLAIVEAEENKCGGQSIAMRATETGYEVIWKAVNEGTAPWENYTLVNSDANPAVKLASENVVVPTTAPGETAEVSFNIDLDADYAGTDPLWMEFYMSNGSEGFCEFYFEAPAKN